MKIRRLDAHERSTLSVPTQAYCFQPSPPTEGKLRQLHEDQQYYKDNITLVGEDDGVVLAEASAIPMRQNVRGSVYSMAGIAGVVAQPLARRNGHVRAVLLELLGQMRDEGHAVSALYPFRPSFYQRFGYAGVPQTRTVTFSPADLGPLLRADLPGEITWEPVSSGYAAYRDFTQQLLEQRHGFSVHPDYRAVQLRDAGDLWLVTARAGREVIGAVTYRITGHGADLVADDLLLTDALSRALILQFFARHVDQVARVKATIGAGETPELWATDLATSTESTTSFPTASAPMVRVLSLTALQGLPVGPAQATVDIVDDPFISGRYTLDGGDGALDVTAERVLSPTATLTAAGFAGLVYGALGPDDVVVRGLGSVSADAFAGLSVLFPRLSPYLFARF